MNPAELLSLAEAAGIRLWVENGALRFRAEQGRLGDDLRAKLAANRDALIAWLLERDSCTGTAPLSFNQTRLFLIDEIDRRQSTYNMAVAFRSRGRLPVQEIEQAVRAIVRRHEALRSRVRVVNGEARQVILPPDEGAGSVDVERAETASADLREWLGQEAARRFDLASSPPLRVRVLEHGDGAAILFAFHHLFFDGGSYNIFFDELNALLSGREASALPPVALQYPQYAATERDGAASARALRYWEAYLADAPTLTTLPTDRPRIAPPDHRGDTVVGRLGAPEVARLEALAASLGSSLFVTLNTLFAAFLARWTGRRDLVVGSPFDGRDLPGSEGAIGFFATLLPLRFRLHDDPSLAEMVERTGRSVAGAFAHLHVPLEQVMRTCDLAGRTDANPLMQTVFALEQGDGRALVVDGEPLERIIVWRGNVNLEFEVLARRTADGLDFTWSYATSLFERATVEAAADAFADLLTADGIGGDTRLSALPLPGADAPPEAAAAREDELLLAALARQVRSAPGREIIRGRESFTPVGLAAASRRVAEALREHGAGTGSAATVGARSLDAAALAAIVGAWRTGSLVRVEPPGAGDDCVRLEARGGPGDAAATAIQLDLSRLLADLAAGADAEEEARALERDAALVGAGAEALALTEAPDGSPITHGALARLLGAVARLGEVTAHDTVAATAAPWEEASLLQAWLALYTGARIAPPRPAAQAETLVGRLVSCPDANVFHLPGSAVDEAVAEGWAPPAGTVLIFERSLAAAATLDTLARLCPEHVALLADGRAPGMPFLLLATLPVGHERERPALAPLPGVECALLDLGRDSPAPAGAVGEIAVSAGAAAGGRDRTGILATQTADGRFRPCDGEEALLVDPPCEQEVRAALAGHAGVEAAEVALRTQGGRRQLVASASGTGLDLASLERHLAARLRPHWRPVLRQHAPASRGAAWSRHAEETVAAAWQQVLGARPGGVHANFFSAGGHSLLAVRLANALSARTGRAVAPLTIFERPTVAALAELVDGFGVAGQAVAAATIPRLGATVAPLSKQQLRLWAADRTGQGAGRQTVPLRYEICGRIADRRALAAAFDDLVARHASLRTTFEGGTGAPRQIVHPPFAGVLRTLYLSDLDEEQARTAGEAFERSVLATSFDLTAGPLIKAGLVSYGEERHILCLTIHHIVTDAWSTANLLRDLGALYESRLTGAAPDLPKLEIDYGDYAVWQAEEVARGMGQGVAYWQSRLEGAPHDHGLQAGARPEQPSHAGATFSTVLAEEQAAALEALAAGAGTTLFVAVSTAMAWAAARLAGRDKVVLGTPGANRHPGALEPLVGLFVEAMPILFRLLPGESFAAAVARNAGEIARDRAHHDVPLAAILRAAGLRPDGAMHPLFQIIVTEADARLETFSLGEAVASYAGGGGTEARFDLSLTFHRRPGRGMTLSWTYAEEVLDAATVRRLAAAFEEIVGAPSALPKRNDDPEATGPEASAGASPLLAMFDAHALATPDAPACRWAGGSLHYGALREGSWRIGAALAALGVEPEQGVALLFDRTGAALAGMLGALRAGAAYVPLEPQHPTARLRTILADSDARVLLADEPSLRRHGWTGTEPDDLGGLEGLLPQGCACLILGADGSLRAGRAAAATFAEGHAGGTVAAAAGGLAYILYTSGTTGRPRGVLVEQTGVRNYLLAQSRFLTLAGTSTAGQILCLTSFAFDTCVSSLWGALGSGRCVYLASEDERYDPEFVGEALCRPDLFALAYVPPALLAELSLPEGAALVERIVVSGEAAAADLIGRLAGRTGLFNEYGPTETTVCATVHRFRPGDEPVRIGRPIDGVTVSIRDAAGEEVADGAEGELWIGGAGVSRGYLHAPELTAEKFVTGADGERRYRTGDWVRRLPGGDLLFLGRRDNQVKLRGQRLELGEIAAHLERVGGVRGALVRVRKGAGGREQLAAYLLAAPDHEDRQAAMARAARDALETSLPPFMVPALWCVLGRWPLNINGKIDEAALPEAMPLRALADRPAAPPRPQDDRARETLANLWEGLLGAKPLPDSHFFDAGGDSITALQLVARAAEKGIRLAVGDVMRGGTLAAIASLARSVNGRPAPGAAEEGPLARDGTLPLLPMQREFLERATAAQRDRFNQAMLLVPKRRLTASAVRAATARLIARHEALRLRFEEGPEGWRARLSDDVEEDAIGSAVRVALPDLQPGTIAAACDAQHRALDVRFGPLFRIALLDHPEGQRLLLTVHHLAIDALSWPVILSDLGRALADTTSDDAAGRPPSRYSEAIRLLAELPRRPEVQAEVPFWRTAVARTTPGGGAVDTVAVPAPGTGSLDPAATRRLLARARPGSAGLDVVLAALALGARRCGLATGAAVAVSVETHGRAAFERDLDVSATVGWFSSTYPVHIDLPAGAAEAPDTALAAARQALDHVPAGGAHYEILRESGVLGERVEEPGLLLNYFGRLSAMAGTETDGLFEKAPEPSGSRPEEVPMRPRAATMLCGVSDDRLEFTILPGAGRLSAEQAEALRDGLERALLSLAGGEQVPPRSGSEPPTIPPGGEGRIADSWPATGMQQGMLFEEQVRPGLYLTRMQLSFAHAVGDHLRRAFTALVGRHAALRSCFRPDAEGTPHQIVFNDVEVPWRTSDLAHLSPAEREARIAAAREEQAAASLDLAAAPLLRVHELLLEADRRLLLWSVHHSCIDGWSLPIALRELCALHDASAKGGSADLPPAPSFGSFARWVHAQDPEQSLAHWRGRLAGISEATPLPTRQQAPERDGQAKLELEWDAASSRRLAEAAGRYRCTAATLLKAAWGALLARYSGRSDVLFGMVVAGRPPELADAQRAIGLFINTVPARVRIDAEQRVEEWVHALQAESVEDMAHAFLPLREVEALVPGLGGRLFRSVLAVENYPVERRSPEAAREGLQLEAAAADEQTNFELTLQAQLSERLRLRLSYAVPAFDAAIARRLMRDFEALLTALCRDGGTAVGALPIRPSLAETTGRAALAPAPTPCLGIALRFAAVAQATPAATAVEHGGRRISYAELDRQSDALARTLAGRGGGAGQAVGIRAPRGIDAIAAMLAVLKLGAAYLPIDPRFPAARARAMLDQAGAKLLLTAEPAGEAELEGIARIDIRGTGGPEAPFDLAEAGPEDPAYIMFTSGSTGAPKGVVVPHRAVERLVIDADYVDLAAKSRVAHVSNPAFDASTFEIWGALLNGGCVVVLDDEAVQDAARFGDALRDAAVDTLFLTTALLDQIVALRPDSFACLDQLLFGGEAVDPRTVETLLSTAPPRRLIHVYGPTENTTFSTAFAIAGAAPSYPIGRFINGTSGVVLSPERLPVPPGEAGELYLCGAGLALGYAGRPDLTGERFVALPGAAAEMLFYRTGDLVRADEQGEITFVGRIDKQVKVRGFRVEPDEVRLQLLEAAGVADAHVLAVGEAGDRQLAAAVVLAGDRAEAGAAARQGLEDFLRARLPAFMVPSAWLIADALPLTPNGKVDEDALRRRLAAADVAVVNANLPRDSIEMGLYRIWGEVLRAQHVSVEDDFFSVGGTSISAIRLRHRIQQAFGIDVPLAEFLKAPTIASVAARIREGRRGGPAPEPQRMVTFKEGAGGTDIVCVHPAGGTTFTYLPLARALPDAHRVTGIQAFGVERDEPLPPSIEAMARSYLARLEQDDRPRIFVGASFGGLVAYEMARQQAAQGRPAAAIMLDSQATDDPRLLATIQPVTLDVFRQKLVKYSGMYPGISDEEIDRYFRLYNHHLMLMKDAGLKPSAARTALVLATGDKVPAHQQAMVDYWRLRAADLHVEKVGGDHSTVIEPPQLIAVIALVEAEAARLAASVRGREDAPA